MKYNSYYFGRMQNCFDSASNYLGQALIIVSEIASLLPAEAEVDIGSVANEINEMRNSISNVKGSFSQAKNKLAIADEKTGNEINNDNVIGNMQYNINYAQSELARIAEIEEKYGLNEEEKKEKAVWEKALSNAQMEEFVVSGKKDEIKYAKQEYEENDKKIYEMEKDHRSGEIYSYNKEEHAQLVKRQDELEETLGIKNDSQILF